MSKKPIEKRSRTNWTKVDATQDDEIDYTDNPPLDESFWAEAVRRVGLKPQITLAHPHDKPARN